MSFSFRVKGFGRERGREGGRGGRAGWRVHINYTLEGEKKEERAEGVEYHALNARGRAILLLVHPRGAEAAGPPVVP